MAEPTFDLYELDGTFVAALANDDEGGPRPRYWARSAQKILNDTGTGSLSIDLEDADVALLTEDRVVRVSIDGTEWFGWLIGPMEQVTVAPAAGEDAGAEEAGEQRTVHGKGVAAILEDAIVYPRSGGVYGALADVAATQFRRFDWTSPEFDDSGWANAVVVPQPASLAGSFPSGWRDSSVQWIWDALPDGSNNNPTGDVYFRLHFDLGSVPTAAIDMTCDDGLELYKNGELLLSELRTRFLQLLTRSVPTELVAGDNVIAVHGVNGPGSGFDNPAALAVSIMELDQGDPVSSLLVTDSSWKVLAYPAAIPGMTVGKVIRLLVEEAQARGCFASLTLGFTDLVDSAGVAWPAEPDITVEVGKNYLQVLQQFSKLYCDFAVDPDLTLQAWVSQGGAVGASLDIGDSILGLEHQGGEHTTKTALLARWGDSWVERTGGTGRRREGLLELGSATSTPQAERMADAALAQHTGPVVATSVPYEPLAGLVLGVDLDVGDTISVPDSDRNPADVRIHSATVTETDDGWDFALELGTLARDREDRLAARLDRLAGQDGTLDGDFDYAIPLPPANLDPLGAFALSPIATAGFNLNDLGDIVTVSDPGPGDALVWDPNLGISGLWTPGKPSGLTLPPFSFSGPVVPSRTPPFLYRGPTLPLFRLWVAQGTPGTTDTLIRLHLSASPTTVDFTHVAYPFSNTALGYSASSVTLSDSEILWFEVLSAGAGLSDITLWLEPD